MKRSIIVILFFILNLGFETLAQSKTWVLPPNKIDFSSIPAAVITLAGSNNNSYSASNSAFDAAGNLLFYVKDLTVYKADGNQIGTLNYYRDPSLNTYNIPQKEMIVVPVPGSNNQYYILWVGANFTYAGFAVRSAKVTVGTTPTLTNESDVEFITANNFCGLAIGNLINNKYRAYVVTNSRYNLYTISSTGITKAFTPAQTLTGVASDHYPSDVELSPDGLKLAWGNVSTSTVAHVNLNATDGTIGTNSIKITTVANGTGVMGVEFGKNNTLFFTSRNSGIKTIADPGNNTACTDYLTDATICNSHLEMSIDGYLYAINTSGNLVAINTNCPQSSVVSNTKIFYSNQPIGVANQYSLPEQIDYERFVETAPYCTPIVNNLISNPSFECGQTGWNSIQLSNSTYVSPEVNILRKYCGMYSLRLNYQGALNWNFTSANTISVRPGQHYSFSVQAQLEDETKNSFNPVYVSLRYYDASLVEIPNSVDMVTNVIAYGGFKNYSKSITVPVGAAYVKPVVEGLGKVFCYLDNFSLTQTDVECINIPNNLIVDPSFENTTSGWQRLWCTGCPSITSNISGSAALCGMKSLNINHDATNSWWLFAANNAVSVVPGKTYKLKASIQGTMGAGAVVELVAATFNQNTNIASAVDWNFSKITIGTSNLATFTSYETSFTVPLGISYIWPRIQANLTTTIYIDQVSLVETCSNEVLNLSDSRPNLIMNGDFEQGNIGWKNLWGSTNIPTPSNFISVASYCGSKALNINHANAESLWWLSGVTNLIPVKEGREYTIQAKTNFQKNSTGTVTEIAVASYKTTSTADNWNFKEYIVPASSGYVANTFTYTVPKDVKYMEPRFQIIGGGNFFVDNIAMYESDCNTSSNNLIYNPGFELGNMGTGQSGTPTSWYSGKDPCLTTFSINTSTVNKVCGNSSLSIQSSGGNGAPCGWSVWQQNSFSVTAGQQYNLSAYSLAPSITGIVTMVVSGSYSNNQLFEFKKTVDQSQTFNKISMDFTIPLGVSNISIGFLGDNSACSLYVDNVELLLLSTNPVVAASPSVTQGSMTTKYNIVDNTINFTYAGKTYTTDAVTNYFFDKWEKPSSDKMILHGYVQPVYIYQSRINSFPIRATLTITAHATDTKIELTADNTHDALKPGNDPMLAFPGKISIGTLTTNQLVIPLGPGLIMPNRDISNGYKGFYDSAPNPKAGQQGEAPTQQAYFNNLKLWKKKASMSFSGVVDNAISSGYIISSDDPWDTEMFFGNTDDGQEDHQPRIIHHFSKGMMDYTRTFYYSFVNTGGYVDLMKWYKSHVVANTGSAFSYYNTFAEKKKSNKNVENFIGSNLFYILNNSYDPKQYATKKYVEGLYRLGIDKAYFALDASLSYFNNKVYDLASFDNGTFDKLDVNTSDVASKASCISYINSNNMIASRYDIYTDVWDPAIKLAGCPDWTRKIYYSDDVVLDFNNNPTSGWPAKCDSNQTYQGSHACSQNHSLRAQDWITHDLYGSTASLPNLPSTKTTNLTGRYFDVEMTDLEECYNPSHPVTRKKDAENRNELFKVSKNTFGLVTGTEDSHDFTHGTADFGEGVMRLTDISITEVDCAVGCRTLNPGLLYLNNTMNQRRVLPLLGLVYHNVFLPTWHSSESLQTIDSYTDINNGNKKYSVWDKKDLFNVLHGTPSMISPSNPNNDNAFPNQKWDDIFPKVLTSYHLTSAMLRATGYSAMLDHKIYENGDVQWSKFEGIGTSAGWEVAANFKESGSATASVKGKSYPISELGFFAANGTDYVYKSGTGSEKKAIVNMCDLDGKQRFYMDPYGTEKIEGGVKSSDIVFLKKKDTDKIHLSILNSQNKSTITFYLNPILLNWGVTTLGTSSFTDYSATNLTVECVGDCGQWYKITFTPAVGTNHGENYFIINGIGASNWTCTKPVPASARMGEEEFMATISENVQSRSVAISPNPNNGKFKVIVTGDGCQRIEIKDAFGKTVITKEQVGIENEMDFSHLSSGIYFAQLYWDNEVTVQRIIISK